MKKVIGIIFICVVVFLFGMVMSQAIGQKNAVPVSSESQSSAQQKTATEKQTITSKQITRSQPQTTAERQTTTTPSYSYDYVANKNTKKFHYPWCASVDQMSEKNKWFYSGSRYDLIDMGFNPCQRCNP